MEDTKARQKISRGEIVPVFLGFAAVVLVICFAMWKVQPKIMNHTYLYDFMEMMGGVASGSLFYKVAWFLADLTEGTFLASAPAAILMVIGAFIASHLEKKKSKHAGTGVAGNSQLFYWMFFSMVISLILGQLLFDGWIANGFIPTFAAFLTVQPMITQYGKGFAKCATVIIAGTLVTFFSSYLVLRYLILPVGLPLFISVSIGVFITVPLCTAIFKLMPWMTPAEVPPEEEQNGEKVEQSRVSFFIHNVFGDVGNLNIWGSSIAMMFMYVGAIISWILNPLHPVYSTGVFPIFMGAQLLTAALAIFIYYPTWKRDGFAFTFSAVVFTSAVLSSYPCHPVIVISTVVVAALIQPGLVAWTLKMVKFHGQFHPIPFIQLSIFPICSAWSFVVMKVLMPLLGL